MLFRNIHLSPFSPSRFVPGSLPAAFSPSGAKDDPQDAELALELMLRYPQR
jgi:hypothetical protein